MNVKLEALAAIIVVSMVFGAAIVLDGPSLPHLGGEWMNPIVESSGYGNERSDDWQYGRAVTTTTIDVKTTTTVQSTTTTVKSPTGTVDNWKYGKIEGIEYDAAKPVTSAGASATTGWNQMVNTVKRTLSMDSTRYKSAPSQMMAESTIGFSTGGAKDVNNFRQNIVNGYLPRPSDITYEGLFYDYYFDTGMEGTCDQLFCPSYKYAVTEDPISGKDDIYLAVGLNSGMTESDFTRKKLNLVIVLDISGSMGSRFNQYYYDGTGTRRQVEGWEDGHMSKMDVATRSITELLDHLDEGDRFGMVLYDNKAYLAKPVNDVADTDMEAIKGHILDLRPQGGTKMSAGMRLGTEQLSEYMNVDPEEYENRIIFLTDAMPNQGDTSKTGLLGMTQSNADSGIYTTFIGIGVDFQTELIEAITKVRGANYHSVHSSKQFGQRMDEGFEFMVTPMVFDLELTVDAKGYKIEKVYGSPEADEATGQIMRVKTLFPSKVEDGETKGGIVILKLKKTSNDGTITIRTSYEDRSGKVGGDRQTVEIKGKRSEYFGSDGIRKAVLLSRYADLMKNWMNDERGNKPRWIEDNGYMVTKDRGICIPHPYEPSGSSWERQSDPLRVSSHYSRLFTDFADYFEDEMDAIGDKSLDQELNILEKLAKNGGYRDDGWEYQKD